MILSVINTALFVCNLKQTNDTTITSVSSILKEFNIADYISPRILKIIGVKKAVNNPFKISPILEYAPNR